MLSGKAPTGAVLRLTKEFKTSTSPAGFIHDRLVSTLVVPSGGKYTWHVNPSTRPEVMEHRVRILAGPADARADDQLDGGVWTIGDQRRHPVPDAGDERRRAQGEPRLADAGRPRPRTSTTGIPTARSLEVGSSGEFVLDKEEAIIELPEPGNYVLRAINFASATPSFTMTAGLYGVVGEDVFGGNVVESYKLTCEKPDGTVLQTASVAVDRGRTQKVNLGDCIRRFTR